VRLQSWAVMNLPMGGKQSLGMTIRVTSDRES
jgi:hypothetical protein